MSLNRPKIFAMRVPPEAIRLFGCNAIASTAPFEAAHKEVKPGVQHTNRHHATMLEQVAWPLLARRTSTAFYCPCSGTLHPMSQAFAVRACTAWSSA